MVRPVEKCQLPPKETALFKRVVKCYEQKQYKNGLKFAKQILSNTKYSEHGETLAMKGLILNCLGRREEAYDHVRRGLRNDLRSHVCWHVFGLLQRADKKYEEAIKAYRNALKWDKENIQILRDLSLLQIQMRDLDGYKDTRYTLFLLRPSQRPSWIGYAMAHHLTGDYDMALNVLQVFKSTQTSSKSYDYENSELLLYENLIYREAGKFKDALEALEAVEDQICDKLSYLEVRASLLLNLGRSADAAAVYRMLLNRNPENVQYYKGLESCICTGKGETADERFKLSQELGLKYPRAMVPRRLPLDFVSGPLFRDLCCDYLKHSLRKGAPALFVDVRSLYADNSKVQIIEHVVNGFLENLEKYRKFDSEASSPEESPSTILWVFFYMAQHYDYLGQSNAALKFVDFALNHTPTLIELFVAKAKIFKDAARLMEEAQSLDTADRYLNSKATKYLLRANRIKDAESMAAKFTREGVNAVENLNEMQCMWFQIESARAYRRLAQYGESLKKCHEVDRHFTDIIEDQFDFHTYCVRKMTLSAYWKLLKTEDTLRLHPFYFKAVKCALKIYLMLHDKPIGTENRDTNEIADFDANILKKQKNKERKAARKAEIAKEQAKALAERQQQHIKAKAKEPKEENDPEAPVVEALDPDKLLRVEKPLDEAVRLFSPLMELDSKFARAFVLGFDIYLRRGKLLLMLQCIKKIHTLNSSLPELHLAKIKFLLFKSKCTISSTVTEVLQDEICSPLFSSSDPFELNKQYALSHANSLPHILAVAQSQFVLDPNSQKAALTQATNLDYSLANRTWKVCRKVLKRLVDGSLGSVSQEFIASYKRRCFELFPLSSVFAPAQVTVNSNCDPAATVGNEELNNDDAEHVNDTDHQNQHGYSASQLGTVI